MGVKNTTLPQNRQWLNNFKSSNSIGVVGVTILLIVVLSITQSGFLTPMNLATLLATVGVLFVVSMGQTFVVLTGGIDLSVGSQLALVCIVLSNLLQAGVPDTAAIVISILAGGILGYINGFLIGPMKLSFFVVTLGAMGLWRGVVYLWSGGKTSYLDSDQVLFLGGGQFFGIPVIIIVMVITLIAAAFVLRYTHFGRDVYAVGGNLEAARLSGIRVNNTLTHVYMVCGLLAGLAAVLQSGRIGAACPTIGEDLALQTAAAVLLGGTSFKGGIGGVTGTMFGVLFIAVLQNGLGIAGVSSYWQQIVTGFILILAVLFDKFQRSKS